MKQTPNFMVKNPHFQLQTCSKRHFPVGLFPFPIVSRRGKMRNLRGGSHHNATDDHHQTEPGTWKFIGISIILLGYHLVMTNIAMENPL